MFVDILKHFHGVHKLFALRLSALKAGMQLYLPGGLVIIKDNSLNNKINKYCNLVSIASVKK